MSLFYSSMCWVFFKIGYICFGFLSLRFKREIWMVLFFYVGYEEWGVEEFMLLVGGSLCRVCRGCLRIMVGFLDLSYLSLFW